MDTPDHLAYSAEHEWVDHGSTTYRFGITDYAQDALGDVVFVDLPEVGSSVQAGDKIAEVESTKSVSEIYAPVSGTVVEVNTALTDSPELLNTSPYVEGWIGVIEPSDGSQVETLMTAEAYRLLLEQ
jgi:glycine cleavage system H protein